MRVMKVPQQPTFTDGEDEKVVLLFERVLSQFVPRSRRSRRRALQNSHDELEARDDDNDDDGGIKSLIKDVNLIDVSGLHNTDERADDDALTLKETTKITTTTNLAELHEQRENERVRSLAQTSSSTVRSLCWITHTNCIHEVVCSTSFRRRRFGAERIFVGG